MSELWSVIAIFACMPVMGAVILALLLGIAGVARVCEWAYGRVMP